MSEVDLNIANYSLSDILQLFKIENGLDENVTTKEIEIPGFKNELIYILVTISILILLVTSLKGNTKSKPKSD